MNVSELFVKCLENEGVERIYGVPGEENLAFLEALRGSNIEFIVTRHEQAAGFMAATYGRLTGRAGVALSTLGPGATNFTTAAAYAQLGAMPVLFITGQKPIKKSKQGAFQIIDTVEIMRPVTKFTKQITNGNNVTSWVREAFRHAEEERPGAVHLELPEDIAEEVLEEDDLKFLQPIPVERVRRPVAEEKAIRKAAELIESAKSPLLLIGAAANRKTSAKMLREFVDATGIPFFTTQLGKGVIDERHELYLGTAALSSGDFVHEAVASADLIINVGHDVIEKPPFIMADTTAKVIHLNYFSAQVDRVYHPQAQVIGDIANAVWQLKEVVKPQAWDFSKMMEARDKLRAHIERDAALDVFPMAPSRIVQDVRAAMPEDGIVCLDNGMYKLWFTRNYEAQKPNTLLVDNALATMGAGLPSAIGAKITNPEKVVVTVAGDGGFMMNSQEMETALRLGLDLIVIILNDSAYGMIKWKQKGGGFTDFALDFSNPDFVKYAESYGAHGHRVQSAGELKPLLEKLQKERGVHVVEVPINYDDYNPNLTK